MALDALGVHKRVVVAPFAARECGRTRAAARGGPHHAAPSPLHPAGRADRSARLTCRLHKSRTRAQDAPVADRGRRRGCDGLVRTRGLLVTTQRAQGATRTCVATSRVHVNRHALVRAARRCAPSTCRGPRALRRACDARGTRLRSPRATESRHGGRRGRAPGRAACRRRAAARRGRVEWPRAPRTAVPRRQRRPPRSPRRRRRAENGRPRRGRAARPRRAATSPQHLGARALHRGRRGHPGFVRCRVGTLGQREGLVGAPLLRCDHGDGAERHRALAWRPSELEGGHERRTRVVEPFLEGVGEPEAVRVATLESNRGCLRSARACAQRWQCRHRYRARPRIARGP